uniref:Putative ribonuclease H-like domain-containing protein n=1 Tax=Tanacetum cinerariifolium TaxID=118510 RepID=A0A699I1S9_TANCI|nr:putative ribonuclease H-like domain-containing protein [Tanacetum cinerariifolium]
MAAAADLDEIEEVNANCILMANLQQASSSGTQTDSAPVYDSDGSAGAVVGLDGTERGYQGWCLGEPSRPVLTRNQLRSDGDMCIYALTVSTMKPKNVKEDMTDPAWIESMQEELL